MCEELGSGWDRIALECELMQLPAPKIVLYEENTKVTLFSSLPFASIPHEEKLWSCYLHACIKYLTHEGLTNSSLRQRFGLGDTASAQVSRLIKEAVSMGLIKPFLLAICFLHKYRGGVTQHHQLKTKKTVLDYSRIY